MCERAHIRRGIDIEKEVDLLFASDARANGEHSAEFLHAYFSATMFIQQWLIRSGSKTPEKQIDLISAIASKVAERYIDRMERQLSARVRM